jgi:hypothetical protein
VRFCAGYIGDGKITIFKQGNHILNLYITKQLSDTLQPSLCANAGKQSLGQKRQQNVLLGTNRSGKTDSTHVFPRAASKPKAEGEKIMRVSKHVRSNEIDYFSRKNLVLGTSLMQVFFFKKIFITASV